MTIRALILMVFALAAAAATALFARNWIAAQRAQVENVSVEQRSPATEILVARAPLPSGTFIQEKHMKWQAWPKDGVADGYVVKKIGADTNASRTGLIGAVVRTSIIAGEPITRKRVVQPGDRGFLAAVLNPGARAVSVPVNATTGIAGFVFPGDRVDLILTVKFSANDATGKMQTRYVSKTLLKKIRVIAIDQKTEAEDGKIKLVKNVTLEVDPKQAEKIALSLHMGAISLSLHSLALDKDDATLAALSPVVGREEQSKRSGFTLDSDVFSMGGSEAPSSDTRVQVLRGSQSDKAKN
ncbi:MAG: Flp pilus assembly protein CpaB [Rhodospirillales bacterium]|nr:Flp pilus assembly protein CpaB [Rhodospirillales bacterium]